jgi:hypothetical protein
MKIVSVPHIRHSQRITPKQARRFLNDARNWLAHANRKINRLRYSGRSTGYVLMSARSIGEGLETIERHVEWLKERDFQDERIERLLGQTRERLDDLIDHRSHQDHL